MGLTRSQEAAVVYDDNLIIFAGPGSGKTSTVVAKAGRILQTKDARLCMTTFTAASAEEMRLRLETLYTKAGVSAPRNQFAVGTFHSLILKHYKSHAKTPVRLLSPAQSNTILQSFLVNMPKDDAKEMKLKVERYLSTIRLNPESIDEQVSGIAEQYLAKVSSIESVDLAMMMRYCVTGMQSGAIPLFNITHLIGDEMQDADELQLEIVLLHARKGVKCTLVADDDQTIYEWRNALGYQGLMRFKEEGAAQAITLGENFRSFAEIIDHAQAVIRYNNPMRIEKAPISMRGKGGFVSVMAAGSLKSECLQIASFIDTAVPADCTVGILARTNFHES